MPEGANASNVKAGGAFVEIGGDTGKLDKVLSSARKKLKNFGGNVTALGKSFMKIGAVMVAPLAAGTKIAADFGEQMASVSTMVDQSEVSKFMPGFREDIRKMSVEFGEGTDTISRGLYDILSASIAPAKAISVLRASMKAAKAGMTDTGTAADAITTILNSYKLSADKANSVSDLLFATVKRGKTTFAELAPAVGMVAATASVAGLSMEEMAAILATGTRNGVRTRISVTALNSTLMAFLKPTTKAAKAAKQFGFELKTETLRTIGLIGVIKKMQGATAEQIASVFENRRSLKLIMPVIQDLEGFTIDLALAQERAGLTQEAYSKMTIILMHAMRRLKQSVVDLLRSVGITLQNRTKAWTESVIGLVDAIKLWIKQNPQLLTSYATLAVKLLALGASLMVIGKGITAISGLLSPGGLFAIGMGSILYFSGLIDDNTKKWLDWVGEIELGATTVSEVFRKIKALWKDLRPQWDAGIDALSASWNWFMASMRVGWLRMSREIVQGIITMFSELAATLAKKSDDLAKTNPLLASRLGGYGVAATEAATAAGEVYSKFAGKIIDAEAALKTAADKRTKAMEKFEAQVDVAKEKVKALVSETVKAVTTAPVPDEPKLKSAAEKYGKEFAAELKKEGELTVAEREAELKYGRKLAVELGFIKQKGVEVPGDEKAIGVAAATGEIIGTFQGAMASLVAGGPRRVLDEQLNVMKGIEDNTRETADNINDAIGLA